MAYIDTDDYLETLAAHLKFEAGPSALPAQTAVYAPQAVEYAYQEILGRLLNRGFTIAQIDSWGRREEFNRDIALWFGFRHAAESEDKDLWPKTFDRRAELDTVIVVAGGVLQSPDGASGQVSYGRIDTSDDRFNRDTRW